MLPYLFPHFTTLHLAFLALAVLLAGPMLAHAIAADFPICKGSHRVTCIVDGDTLWYLQVKYRLEGIDTPEMAPRHKCMQEGLQARLARDRLQEIIGYLPLSAPARL